MRRAQGGGDDLEQAVWWSCPPDAHSPTLSTMLTSVDPKQCVSSSICCDIEVEQAMRCNLHGAADAVQIMLCNLGCALLGVHYVCNYLPDAISV
eukprot:378796-Pyramimonas_sp.AAC.1